MGFINKFSSLDLNMRKRMGRRKRFELTAHYDSTHL